MTNKLKSVFATAIAAASFSVVAAPPSSSTGRELTKGETDMAYLFGDELDPSIVRLHAGPSKGKTIAETFDTTTIAYYGHPYLSWDYSKEKDAVNYGSQFHEITHIWQYQNGWAFTRGHCPGGYHYVLARGKQFNDYCSEAQGAIVEDYSRRYLMPVSAPSKWFVDMCGYDTPDHDSMLLKMVEDRFPNAKEMRLKIGRGVALPDARPRPIGAPACTVKDPHKPKDGGGKDDGKKPGPDGKGPDQQKPDQPKDDGKAPNDSGQKRPDGKLQPSSKKGTPTYFCETFADTLKKIKGLAFVQGLAGWQGFEAELVENDRVCKITIDGKKLIDITSDDFMSNGQMSGASLARLVELIVRNTPPEIRGIMNKNIDALFDQMVSKQIAEKNALRKMTSRPDIEKKVADIQRQLKDDPSLPDNSRGFLQEKLNILNAKLKPVIAKPKPDADTPFNAGGGRGKAPGPSVPGEAKPKPAESGDPDRNIKDILNSAYGADRGTSPAPAPRGP